MEKVGILTFHRAVNYGAALQAYALQKTIIQLGYECEVIDYVTAEHEKRYDISNINPLEKIWYPKYNEMRHKKFQEFVESKLCTSGSTLHLKKEVEKVIGNYDIVIVGSDQIWNPDCIRKNIATDIYFLNLNNVNYKIAYAPSIGDNSTKQLKKYLEFIKDFDYIWMREQTVADELSLELGREINSILDPVFLLNKEEWFQLARKKYTGKPYLFYYEVREDDYSFQIAYEIAKREKLKIVTIGYHQRFFGKDVINCCDAGPIDFLNIIRNATMVVTTSFHGSALALIMEKPLLAIKQKEKDYRLIDVLKLFGMESQYIDKHVDVDSVECKRVSDDTVHKERRKEAIDCLREALEASKKSF